MQYVFCYRMKSQLCSNFIDAFLVCKAVKLIMIDTFSVKIFVRSKKGTFNVQIHVDSLVLICFLYLFFAQRS